MSLNPIIGQGDVSSIQGMSPNLASLGARNTSIGNSVNIVKESSKRRGMLGASRTGGILGNPLLSPKLAGKNFGDVVGMFKGNYSEDFINQGIASSLQTSVLDDSEQPIGVTIYPKLYPRPYYYHRYIREKDLIFTEKGVDKVTDKHRQFPEYTCMNLQQFNQQLFQGRRRAFRLLDIMGKQQHMEITADIDIDLDYLHTLWNVNNSNCPHVDEFSQEWGKAETYMGNIVKNWEDKIKGIFNDDMAGSLLTREMVTSLRNAYDNQHYDLFKGIHGNLDKDLS
jgi:hypothetical protein